MKDVKMAGQLMYPTVKLTMLHSYFLFIASLRMKALSLEINITALVRGFEAFL